MPDRHFSVAAEQADFAHNKYAETWIPSAKSGCSYVGDAENLVTGKRFFAPPGNKRDI